MKTQVTEKTDKIASQIHFIRGEKVMLDFDLSFLYGVETRSLKQAVKRNIDRFPGDFMFELKEDEIDFLVSQFVIPSKSKLGGAKPYAFTEQGVAMLSGILNSKRAIEVNIAIMRTFVQIRKLMQNNNELAKKINQLEKKYDENFRIVFDAIKQLIQTELKTDKKIGQGDIAP